MAPSQACSPRPPGLDGPRKWALALLAATTLALVPPGQAQAQAVKPRFVVIFDTSGSMTENAGRRQTHGDGSQDHPGCDLDNNGLYDDSKLYQAKAALAETITAFGSAQFALARYRQKEFGQPCPNTTWCQQNVPGSNICIDGHCAYDVPIVSPDYDECTNGSANTNGCIRCANPGNDPTHVNYQGNDCCIQGDPVSGGAGMAGDVLVPFPAAGPNQNELLAWMDGRESFPLGSDRELRGTGSTPIGGALNAVRDWLTRNNSPVGAGAGVVNRDNKADCRAYNVILITDGLETNQCATNCRIDGALAADGLYHACSNGGFWDFLDNRCEIDGSPNNTHRIKVRTYVVGFNVNDPSLNSIAASGGTGIALLANNQAELTARLGDIVAASIPREKCDCQDNTCDDAVDETFVKKGQACEIGVGRCKRQGVYACAPDGNDVICSSSPAGMCPGTQLTPGQAVTETCGAAAGCGAPSAQDCADDDCDGLVDENLTCMCANKPEVCNGVDDDCNGLTDDIANTACGLDIGQCRPGRIRCVNGQSICEGGSAPTPEICDGKDNDCDGITDGFGLACYSAGAIGCELKVTPLSCAAATADAWQCQGICQSGVVTCDNGTCGQCMGAVTPQTEVACDGLDNDCDGQTDEGFNIGQTCGAGQGKASPCEGGVWGCENNRLLCLGGTAPGLETCDGIDDNCDGTVDNVPGACGFSGGACVPGTWLCLGDEQICVQPQGPRAEICDGADNDCDGNTDEDPIDPDLLQSTACGTEQGVCTRGVLACIAGGKVCTNNVGPSFERCNALDDDCDGQADEGINGPGPCPPPGLSQDAPALGLCRPGKNTCVGDGAGGARWMCTGGVGPTLEICDGKDNNCNGAIDDNASCGAASVCADGQCAPLCPRGQGDCPKDRTCDGGICKYHACVRNPCAAGFYCDGRRGCVDRCEGVVCPAGRQCDNGACTTCQDTGCAEGLICRVQTCEPNPCAGLACETGSYCRNGACVNKCTNVSCPASQSCVDGTCRFDACRDVQCGHGQFCRPATGKCEDNPCSTTACLKGQVCVPAPGECAESACTDGICQAATCTQQPHACVADPCQITRCDGPDVCWIAPDGRALCLAPEELPGAAPVGKVGVGGTGCACDLGQGSSHAPGDPPWPWLFLASCALFAKRSVQRARKPGHPAPNKEAP